AIRAHRWELSALMGYEAGKNRLECVGDVEEAADLMSYYCDQIERHHGFVEPMGTLGPGEENVSVLRPYGVWAVISPFNFPMALAAGPRGRRAGSRKHRGAQAGHRHAASGREALPDDRGSRAAAGRLQLCHGPRLDGRARAHRQRRRGRYRLYWIQRG